MEVKSGLMSVAKPSAILDDYTSGKVGGANIEFRAQALNLPNLTNFTPNNNIGASFGQTTAAYRDTSGTVDPGGRILEFFFRLNF